VREERREREEKREREREDREIKEREQSIRLPFCPCPPGERRER
jgi:hypothetical protein